MGFICKWRLVSLLFLFRSGCGGDVANISSGCAWGESVGMYLALATGHGNVDETASVDHTLVGATLGVLLLLLGLDLDAKLSLNDGSGLMTTATVSRVAFVGFRV